MMQELQRQIEKYTEWIKEKTILKQAKDSAWVTISTPFIDRHNDCIDIYIKQENDNYILTDDGYTVDDLEQSGFSLGASNSKRRQILIMTLNGFGVRLECDALVVKVPKEKFPVAKHNLIQAILAVNDMFYMSQPVVKNLFQEDVSIWLDSHDVRYTKDITLMGRSTFVHHFHFLIPKSRSMPERIIRALNNPSRDTVESLVFAWTDSRESRPQETEAYAILNDANQSISGTMRGALKNYGIKAVPWSQNTEFIADFTH